MDIHPAHVQAAVQHLVIEHGEYAPLELLLATNRLSYDDYRAWREGRRETLDSVLTDGRRELCAWLEGTRSWARALGLAAESAVHHGWENIAGIVLVASADPRLNALLSTRFRHAQEHDQLDLFIDRQRTNRGGQRAGPRTDGPSRQQGARGPRAARPNQPRPWTPIPRGQVDLGAGGTDSGGTRAGA